MKNIKLIHYPKEPDVVEPTPQELFDRAMREVKDPGVDNLRREPKYDRCDVEINIEAWRGRAGECIDVTKHIGVSVVDNNDEVVMHLSGPMKGLSLTKPTVDLLKSLADGKWKIEGGEFIPAEDIDYILDQFCEFY